MVLQIRRATKTQRKARIGLVGPTGSGKTYSALRIATGLVGENGRILVADTENRSADLYADQFQFDVVDLETFSPDMYIEVIRLAEQEGYDALIIDSLSHAWMGKDGALEQVDKAAARSRSGNSFVAWREVTPKHNAMVDALIRCKCHLIVTMRAKTEYVLEEDIKGRKVPRKIGMAPIQRDGLDYEFDIVGDMDYENRLIISKTRYSRLAGEVIEKPSEELGEEIAAWLSDGAPAPLPRPAARDINNVVGDAMKRGWIEDEIKAVVGYVRGEATFEGISGEEWAKVKEALAGDPPGPSGDRSMDSQTEVGKDATGENGSTNHVEVA